MLYVEWCFDMVTDVFVFYRGASPIEVDNQGMTPLHYACSAGRPRNVDILLKKSKEGNITYMYVGLNTF